jgi:hypothetical protein
MNTEIPLKTQVRWLAQQRKAREGFLAEGVRGGHSTETLARYQNDITILDILLLTLEPGSSQQELWQEKETT